MKQDRKKRTVKKLYSSAAELQRTFFPASYRRRSLQQRAPEQTGFGTRVARDLIKDIKEAVQKQMKEK